MQRVCLCLSGLSLRESLAQLQNEAYFDPNLDVAELRLDFLLDFDSALEQSLDQLCRDITAYAKQRAKPQFVLTLRRQADGGRCPDNLAEYMQVLYACMEAFPAEQLAYVDLDEGILRAFSARETSRFWQLLEHKEATLIASLHDFGPFNEAHSAEGLEKLEGLLRNLPKSQKSCQKTVLKFALMTSSSKELLAFYRLAQRFKQECKRSYILLAMGEFGSSSRILTAAIGSLWSFCSSSGPVAPGQFRLAELIELYHFRSLNEDTEIYGVIGDPIAHSRSPQIHNPVYQKNGWNAVYLRFRVDRLDSFLELSSLLPIRGLSCTIPHKEALAQRCIAGKIAALPAEAADAVQLLGACNTLYWSNCWRGDNTDIQGFLAPLIQKQQKLRGQKAAIIGAGGVARAALYALLREGVHCEIYNRTLQRAKDLAELFAENSGQPEQPKQPKQPEQPGQQWGKILRVAELNEGRNISTDCNLIIQTTSIGMEHKGPNDPIPEYRFQPDQLVYDLIYPQTALLRRAEQAGASILDGEQMLEQQALRQIQLFAEARKLL